MSAYPKSGHEGGWLACPLWAKSGLTHAREERRYSITSSAMLSRPDDRVRPSTLAVLRFDRRLELSCLHDRPPITDTKTDSWRVRFRPEADSRTAT